MKGVTEGCTDVRDEIVQILQQGGGEGEGEGEGRKANSNLRV